MRSSRVDLPVRSTLLALFKLRVSLRLERENFADIHIDSRSPSQFALSVQINSWPTLTGNVSEIAIHEHANIVRESLSQIALGLLIIIDAPRFDDTAAETNY